MFDPEWLAITRAFNPYMSVQINQLTYPDEADARNAIHQELHWVKRNVYDVSEGAVSPITDLVKRIESCQKFTITAPGPGTAHVGSGNAQGVSVILSSSNLVFTHIQVRHWPNPQTDAFCRMLEIENKVDFVQR